MKLSKPQQAILTRLASNERLRSFPKSHIKGAYWSPSFDDYSWVSIHAVRALIDRGLVMQLPNVMGKFDIAYQITDAGKKAVEASDGA